eukprot:scaffold425_cov175-Amphora_coffeaeformis.AAC.13
MVMPCLSLALQERTIVLLYNKPPNVVTSHAVEDVKGRRNVYQDVTSMEGCIMPLSSDKIAMSFEEVTGIKSRLHAVGRLDADTTGALLLTNDGGLVHDVTNRNARHSQPVSKTYHAVIMGYHSNDSVIFQKMREHGVNIGEKYGGMTQPVQDLHVLDYPTPKSTTVSLTISEGKNRQIRRMFHAMGSGVMKLKRVCIGHGLELGSLEEGQWRILSDEEVRTCLSYSPRLLEMESPSATIKTQRKGRKTFSWTKLNRQNRRRS